VPAEADWSRSCGLRHRLASLFEGATLARSLQRIPEQGPKSVRIYRVLRIKVVCAPDFHQPEPRLASKSHSYKSQLIQRSEDLMLNADFVIQLSVAVLMLLVLALLLSQREDEDSAPVPRREFSE
jgi:hypothetical protein